jgi:hypothetical protein
VLRAHVLSTHIPVLREAVLVREDAHRGDPQLRARAHDPRRDLPAVLCCGWFEDVISISPSRVTASANGADRGGHHKHTKRPLAPSPLPTPQAHHTETHRRHELLEGRHRVVILVAPAVARAAEQQGAVVAVADAGGHPTAAAAAADAEAPAAGPPGQEQAALWCVV